MRPMKVGQTFIEEPAGTTMGHDFHVVKKAGNRPVFMSFMTISNNAGLFLWSRNTTNRSENVIESWQEGTEEHMHILLHKIFEMKQAAAVTTKVGRAIRRLGIA